MVREPGRFEVAARLALIQLGQREQELQGPRSDVNAHRPLTPKEDLARILSWQETLSLSKNLTLHFYNTVYQIQSKRPSYALRNAHVTVCLNANDEISILYNGKSLPFTVYTEQARQAQIVSAKHLDQALHKQRMPTIPGPDHPWRKGLATPLRQTWKCHLLSKK